MTKQTFPLKSSTVDKNKNTELDKRLALLRLEIKNADTVGNRLDEFNNNTFFGIETEPTPGASQIDQFTEKERARDVSINILKKIIRTSTKTKEPIYDDTELLHYDMRNRLVNPILNEPVSSIKNKLTPIGHKLVGINDLESSIAYLEQNNLFETFSRFSSLFLKYLSGQTGLSFGQFLTFWNKFSNDVIAKSNNTGILDSTVGQSGALRGSLLSIGSDTDSLNILKLKNVEELKEYKNKFQELLKKIKSLFGKSNKEVDVAFVQSFNEKTGKDPVIGDTIKIYSFEKDKILEKEYTLKKAKTNTALWAFKEASDELTVRNGIKYSYITTNEADKNNLVKEVNGKGLKGGSISQQLKDDSLIPNMKPKQIGKHYVNIRHLHKNYLTYTFKSGNRIINKVLITNDLKKLLFDVLDNNKVDNALYNKLDDNEQTIFDNFLNKTQSSSLLQNHTKASDKEKDTLIKRFTLLKGQLLAGNNAPEIINELSIAVMNLQEQGIMNDIDANKLYKKILIFRK